MEWFSAENVVAVLTAVLGVLASVGVLCDCATGRLTVTGSTAFAPVVRELGKKYEKECEGSEITVDPHGSNAGIRELAASGAEAGGSGSPAVLALSDGPKPGGFPELRETRVAVSLFHLVVNDRVPVRDLPLATIRRIYRGEIRNWRSLGGPDLEIRLVSRNANSGTREVFQRRVLDANEPAQSSRSCVTRDDAHSPVIRCELDSTEQVLAAVARLDGAIGYSELRSGTELTGLHQLAVDGTAPSVDMIGAAAYPYREIEYAYTYGQPPADSLASSFLGYLSRAAGRTSSAPTGTSRARRRRACGSAARTEYAGGPQRVRPGPPAPSP